MFSKSVLKTAYMLLVLGLALVLATACKEKEKKEVAPTSEALGEPRIGGTIYTTSSNPPNFDPITTISGALQGAVSHSYDGLFKLPYGPDKPYNAMFVEPHLAKSWKMENPTTFIITLRDNIKWFNKPPMNGRQFVADDVKFSFERMMAPGSSAGAGLVDIERIEVVDPLNVRFVLKKPNSFFIYSLSYSHYQMMPREVVAQYGDLRKPETLIGTGPFILESFKPNVEFVWKKNPDYYEKDDKGRSLPYVDTIQAKIGADPATTMAMFRTGQIDTRAVNFEEKADIQKTMPQVTIRSTNHPTTAPRAFVMRTDKPPFNDVRVRQAMAMSIDHQKFLNVFYGGEGEPEGPLAGQVVEYSMRLKDRPASVQKYFKQNIPEAKKLLAEAGYPNGFKTTLAYTSGLGGTYSGGEAEVAQEFLRLIGIEAELKVIEYNTWINTYYNGINYEGMAYVMSGAVHDPYEQLYVQFYGIPSSKNRSGVADKTLDGMLDKMLAEYDEAKRKKIIDDIQVYLFEKQYWVFFPSGPAHSAIQPWLKNMGHQGGQGDAQRWLKVWTERQ
ncbi:MAG: ABC transporter substrate-binding protein [Chloroflexi bacterium]|nr:ABC transporter substrate-binding protein [Chloroflexota bacterium]